MRDQVRPRARAASTSATGELNPALDAPWSQASMGGQIKFVPCMACGQSTVRPVPGPTAHACLPCSGDGVTGKCDKLDKVGAY